MIDGYSTTFDWQRHPTRICVMAVGAFEQHSHHLPLATDAILGDYFARKTAAALDAALLPTLRIATSLEHSGFRGSFSLRPETLMQVIRDLADELERQHFNRLILINCHGGNFCLTPVVRDLNRQDRKLKILLTPFYEFAEPDTGDKHRKQGEIHAGEWETSIMLAIAPETVRQKSQDMEPAKVENVPLKQGDLTHFGVGWFAPAGAVGWPSLASPEKGAQIVKAVMKNMLVYINDRLQRFDSLEHYAGRGGIAVRLLVPHDLPAAIELSRKAEWNQLPYDWQTFLQLAPEHCFAAMHNGQVVGTTTALRYADNKLAWIGMVLVDPAFRRLGIATALMQAALASLQEVTVIKLDATAAGAKVYERLGFQAEYSLKRMLCRQVHVDSEASVAMPLKLQDLALITAKDAENIGVQRFELLRRLFESAPELAWKIETPDGIGAFCLGRPGRHFLQIGPLWAESDALAAALLQSALQPLSGKTVGMDVAADRQDFLQHLQDNGFHEQREFLRMTTAEPTTAAAAEYAIAGPEFG